ncbi:response regulator receiver protein [Bosea sp. BK604]|nr:response regulator receiver protein [Bosea sp. BK604]
MAHGSSWIAIVDDDPSVLKSLSRALRIRAFEARTFSSARDFLAALATELPSCLIVDVQMPRMTGLELHHHLARTGVHIPTIVITAYEDARVRDMSQPSDIVAVLSKPLRNAALFDAIALALSPGSSRNGGHA